MKIPFITSITGNWICLLYFESYSPWNLLIPAAIAILAIIEAIEGIKK